MKHRVSCHCGRVAIEAEGTIGTALACNCSMCQRKGSLLWFVPRTQVQFLTDEANAATYLFNKHHIRHRFCPACGIHPYAEAKDPKGVDTIAVNVRCIEGIDLASVPVKQYDGASA